MKRDNRQRGTRNKKCRARPNICALPFRECSSSTPWKEDLSLVSDTATVAGCPRGRRRTHSRTDPSHSEHYAVHMAPYGVYRHSFMHGQRCHSCGCECRCGGRRTAAGKEAVPNLHCKCFCCCSCSGSRSPALPFGPVQIHPPLSGPAVLLLIFRSGPSLARVPPGTRPKICLQPHGH